MKRKEDHGRASFDETVSTGITSSRVITENSERYITFHSINVSPLFSIRASSLLAHHLIVQLSSSPSSTHPPNPTNTPNQPTSKMRFSAASIIAILPLVAVS
jgi:hypothetical protein